MINKIDTLPLKAGIKSILFSLCFLALGGTCKIMDCLINIDTDHNERSWKGKFEALPTDTKFHNVPHQYLYLCKILVFMPVLLVQFIYSYS